MVAVVAMITVMTAMVTAMLATMVTAVVSAMMATVITAMVMAMMAVIAMVGMAMARAALFPYLTAADFAACDVFIIYHIIPPISICNL